MTPTTCHTVPTAALRSRALPALAGCLLLAAWVVVDVAPVAAQAAAPSDIPASWKDIEAPPLPEFEIQQPRRVELDNGLVLFLQPDRELPLIRGVVTIRGGSRNEPAAKTGLAAIYGQAWRTGGTESRTGDELDDFLEARAALVETGADIDSSTVSWDSLAEDFGEVLPIVIDLLENPAFREDKIDLAKEQIRTGIARRNDDPTGIAAREARKLVYGDLSPYARVPEYDTVAAVTRDDLTAWHAGTAHPNNMVVGVTGDFDPDAMEQRLRKAFGDRPRGPAVEVPDIALQTATPGVYLVRKEDVTQSNIRLVHPGIRRDDPDYWALRVMNEIFGGSFSSRLFSSIRSDKGLAYSVGGGVGSAYDHPGMFSISMGTKSGSTLQAIQALYGEISELQQGPITEAELARAQESLLNSFIFEVDSKEEVMREKMTLELYGYPLDFLDRFQDEIRAVSTEEVQRVAREKIHPDELAVLVVGRPQDFEGDLASLGEVREVDVTIPVPGGEAEPIAGNAEGRDLMERVVAGLGGAETVASVAAVRRRGKLETQTPQGAMEMGIDSLEVFPDSMRQAMATPMGEIVMVATPDAAFVITPGGTQQLPESRKADMLQDLAKTPILLAQRAGEPAVVLAAAGSETIGDVEAAILDIELDGQRVRWWIDPESGRILRSESRGMGQGGAPVTTRTDYSDFREVGGVVQPFAIEVFNDGQPAASIRLEEVVVNPEVAAEAFEAPGG